MRQMKCPHCGKKTTDVELASYSGRCIYCRTIPTNPEYCKREGGASIPTEFPEMRQLVGQNCARCQHIIESVYEGRFCRNCGNPVHEKCPDSSTLAVVPGERCQDCGGDLESRIAKEEREKREEQERKIEEAKAKAQLAAESFATVKASMYRRARLLFLMIIGLGFYIIFPNLRQERRFTLDYNSLSSGLAAIVAGLGLIVLSYILQRKSK